ncbi:MAG: hypothetical protein M1823_003226 [Watsoniomyces obsoletus]|nr:MAG: hypothetical protein M1823_003226 [Watsoniomyces obsoletus]
MISRGNTTSTDSSSFVSLASSGSHERTPSRVDGQPESNVGLQRTSTILRNLKRKTKAKTNKLFHQDRLHSSKYAQREEDHRAMEGIQHDPAFNPKSVSWSQDGLHKKPKKLNRGSFRSVMHKVAHPVNAIKNTATKQTGSMLADVEHSAISQRSDLAFLQSQCDLNVADTDGFPGAATQDYMETTAKLERHRESMRVAWVTSRHVQRVRVVPKGLLDFPESSRFKEYDETGDMVIFHWVNWVGNLVLYYTQDFAAQYVDEFDELPFDAHRLKSHVERLVMASAPWQAWMMHVRSVFRWEDPIETGRWLMVYLVLWYTQNVVAFLWAYIIYMVIYNRYHPSSLESLQESIERNLERGSTAHRIGDLIDKHGREEWLGHLIENTGPFLQIQIGDLANLLEVLSNFYAWKSPNKTAASIFLFTTCFLLAILADMKFCMKVLWFVVGVAFFLCWPISSRYPKYRFLVSPVRWVFWDIPTYSEWAFQYLRGRAQVHREEMMEEKVEKVAAATTIDKASSHAANVTRLPPLSARLKDESHGTTIAHNEIPEEEEEDDDFHSIHSDTSTTHSLLLPETTFYSVHCEHNHIFGRLLVTSLGIHFIRSIPSKKEIWHRSWDELLEMKKFDSSIITKLTSMNNIEFLFTDGTKITIKGLKDRDEAFNIIIGFSGLQWQSLQS